MGVTKSEILQRVSSNVNGSSAVPSGDELSLWSDYLESANQEWPVAVDVQALIKIHKTTMLQSGTSVALPEDFKEKLAGFTSIEDSLWEEFSRVESSRTVGDYVSWGGNRQDGYWLNTSRALYSTSRVNVPYHSRPTSMPTLTSISPIPDPEFLIARVSEKALRQRGQPEYDDFRITADTLLLRLAGNEVSQEFQRNNTIRTSTELEGFVIGDD